MMNNRWFKFKDILITNYGSYVLQNVSNLETGDVSRQETRYIDTDGAIYSNITYNPRLFEIGGFIQAEDYYTMVDLKRKLITACNAKEPVRIKYFNRQKEYSALCYFDKLPTFEKRIKWNLPFKLYVAVPGFYWQSPYQFEYDLFKYKNEITDSFTLPCTFTSLVKDANIKNSGDTEIFPIFKIRKTMTTPESEYITIQNNTTNQVMTVKYSLQDGEEITVDMQNKTVKSNIAGNITGCVELNSVFFPIAKGTNNISYSGNGDVASILFYENYLGV